MQGSAHFPHEQSGLLNVGVGWGWGGDTGRDWGVGRVGGGYFITPHVVKEVQDTPLDSLYTDKRYTMVERKNYEIVAEGMRNAVIGGTCRGAAITDIEVCGKTGTAENPHGKDHSAFIGFAPYRNPKVAICVYVENGGFGATYGVPIGKLMMEKYLKGEISEENKLLEETMSNAVVSPNVLSLPNREL